MRRTYLIVASILTLMLTAWFIFMITPTLAKRDKIKNDLSDANIQFKDFENIMLKAPEFYKTHENIKQQKLQLSSKLYSKENLLSLFKELESRASENNLKVIEFTPSVEELLLMNRLLPNENKPQTLNIVVTLSGTLKNIGAFMEGVESQGFYQGVDLCRITNSADGQMNSNLVYGFKAVLGAIGEY
jgi:Tfp pilus assembly protein PilO